MNLHADFCTSVKGSHHKYLIHKVNSQDRSPFILFKLDTDSKMSKTSGCSSEPLAVLQMTCNKLELHIL